jgi:hypothetical protein
MDPTKRALSDQKYAKMIELMAVLPNTAKEYRFAVYEARWNSDSKASFRPLEKILYSRFNEQGFTDEATLANYLDDKYGSGKYYIEALDEHNSRLTQIPAWTVMAGNEEDMYDDEDDSPRPRRGFREGRRRRDDDMDEEEDPRDQRANMADLLTTVGKANASQTAVAAKSQTDMIGLLLLTQQQQAEARALDERRREDQRADERRREDQKADERRKEAEAERRALMERDEQRRKEEREQRDRDEQRRAADLIAQMNAQSKRTEVMLGAVTAIVPILAKVFEKKDDPFMPLMLAKMTEKHEADPMTVMLLKSTLDKANDDSASRSMIQNMGEMAKLNAQLTAEQMKSAMTLSNDINSQVMKKALDMMLASPQGSTPEGKSMIEQVMSALQGASSLVNSLVPPTPAAQPQRPQQQRRHAPALPAPAEAAPATTPTAQAVQSMTPAQKEEMVKNAPKGILAVLGCLQAIHQKHYGSQTEYQGLVQYAIEQMPLELRVAILDGNQVQVISLANPVIESVPEIKGWIYSDGVLPWLMSYIPQLCPSIEAIHGPADQQRQALANPQPAAAPAPEQAQPAAEAQGQAQDNGLALNPDGSMPGDPPAAPAPAAEPTVAAVVESTPAPAAAPASTGSHLDPDAP